MPTRLIINADDFGFSPAVTNGILHCHKQGVLTSTTLMTTMPDRDRAIDLAGQTPTLGVGIHLSLTQGTPLTPCTKILSRDGRFIRSLPKLFLKLQSRDARRHAQDELIAQIQYAQSRGLAPTHVDSHKHVCHLPALHQPLLNACLATGIRWLRTTREPPPVPVPGIPDPILPYRILARFARRLAQRAQAAGLFTPDFFLGLSTTGQTTDSIYLALAEHPPEGLGELMTHPGYIQDLTPRQTRLLTERLTELQALTNPEVRQALTGAKIQLIPYPPPPTPPPPT